MQYTRSECLTLKQPHVAFLKRALFSAQCFSVFCTAIFMVKMVPVTFCVYRKNAQPQPFKSKCKWNPIEIYSHISISCLRL